MTRSLNCLYQGCRIFGKLNEKGLVKYLAGVLITIFTNNVQALFSFDRVHALLAVCPVCSNAYYMQISSLDINIYTLVGLFL